MQTRLSFLRTFWLAPGRCTACVTRVRARYATYAQLMQRCRAQRDAVNTGRDANYAKGRPRCFAAPQPKLSLPYVRPRLADVLHRFPHYRRYRPTGVYPIAFKFRIISPYASPRRLRADLSPLYRIFVAHKRRPRRISREKFASGRNPAATPPAI